MEKPSSGIVVGIAGPAGCGKSTIVERLTDAIPGSATVFFDSYPVEMPPDLRGWLDAGADFDEWAAPDLATDLDALRGGNAVVLFEAPLGRRHEFTGRHIDFLVFVETPLEIALARLVQRELAGGGERLAEYIDAYETVARDVYAEQLRQVKPDAELVVDGREPVEVSVAAILEALELRTVSRATR